MEVLLLEATIFLYFAQNFTYWINALNDSIMFVAIE